MRFIKNFFKFKQLYRKEIIQTRYLTICVNNKNEFKNNTPNFILKPIQFYNIQAIQAFSSASPEIATYNEVKNLSQKKNGTVLIDVREPDELKETGQIPGSVNIPLNDVAQALSADTTPEKFKNLYGIDKPTQDTPLIFHCKIGRRSQTATDAAKQLGFQNVRNYKGSWTEWAEKEGLKQ